MVQIAHKILQKKEAETSSDLYYLKGNSLTTFNFCF
jgi:hypothetical protein